MSGAFYNEHDPQKAAWLRELIKGGLLAPGDVDERSVADVKPDELMGYTQCHFFAGIGVWGHALRSAGWGDGRPVWTGSCPCPSFSAAGKGEGFDDARHLWPAWFRLIRECRPLVIFGEQVDAAIGHGWLDLVGMDLEGEGYAVAAAVLPAASVGAPHKRNRLYFCAHAKCGTAERERFDVGAAPRSPESATQERQRLRDDAGTGQDTGRSPHAHGRQSCDGDVQRGGEYGLFAADCGTGEHGHAESIGRSGRSDHEDGGGRQLALGHAGAAGQCSAPAHGGLRIAGSASGSAGYAAQPNEAERGLYADFTGCEAQRDSPDRTRQCDEVGLRSATCQPDQPLGAGLEGHFGDVRDWRGPGWLDPLTARSVAAAGATRGFWADCDWWYGRDGKWRPIGPRIQPLAHGATSRVVKLRGYGDAIVAPAAQAFIEAAMEAMENGRAAR